MPDVAREALRLRYETQLAALSERRPDLVHGGAIDGSVAIVADGDGNRIRPSGFGRWWNRNRKGYGFDGVTLHQLRHTFLTLAAVNGIHPSVMQKLAGHSTSRLTMDIYTHVQMDSKREAMSRLGGVFSPPNPAKASSGPNVA